MDLYFGFGESSSLHLINIWMRATGVPLGEQTIICTHPFKNILSEIFCYDLIKCKRKMDICSSDTV